MAPKERPTQAQWDRLRAEIVDQYIRQGRTVRWIVEDLNRHGFKVTKKMLWDRFSTWQVPRKYNSKQISDNRPPSQLMLGPAKPLATPPHRRRFQVAMKSVGDWFQGIIESGSWRLCSLQRRIDMQRLVSRATLAIATENYDTKARSLELNTIAHQTHLLLTALNDRHKPVHPRHLIALLRLWVADWQETPWRRDVHQAVRRMIVDTSRHVLLSSHPIAAVSHAAIAADPNELIVGLFHQWRNHFLLPVRVYDLDFYAREQVYAARVLASIGRTDQGMSALRIIELDDNISKSTIADYHSTTGYTLMQAKKYEDAIAPIESSIEAYEALDEGVTEGAQYAHFCLNTCYEALNDLPKQEFHLTQALRAWQVNASLQRDQGGLNIVRELHSVYEKQDKTAEMLWLRQNYARFFEEAPGSPD